MSLGGARSWRRGVPRGLRGGPGSTDLLALEPEALLYGGKCTDSSQGLSCHYCAPKSKFKDVWDVLGMPASRGARWAWGWGLEGNKDGPSDVAGPHRDWWACRLSLELSA